MRRKSLHYTALLVIALTFGLAGCGPNEIGHGVVLWPPNGLDLQAAQVVPIQETSELRETYSITHNEQISDVAMWRLAFFESREGADEYAREYEPFADQYAQSLRRALPIREKADRTSTRIYRMRDGEIVKVLRRQEEQSDEAGLVDYWYQVLTTDGTIGWVFGYHLDLVDTTGRSLTPREDATIADRMVQEIASQVWRPDYFRSMIDKQRVDLTRFQPQYRFELDLEDQIIRIVLPDQRREIQFLDYFSPTDNTLELQPEGVTIFMYTADEIRVQYRVGGQQTTSTFIIVEENIDQVIATERQRRRNVLQSFLDRGNVLVSTAYGTMELDADGNIAWEGYERLIPQVLPVAFDGVASLDFSLFLQPDLRARYDGALRVVPENSAARAPAFLYRLSEEGVRLEYVPEENINNDLVEEEPLSPVILFYRFVSS